MRLSPVTPQQTKGRPMKKLHNYISKCYSFHPATTNVKIATVICMKIVKVFQSRFKPSAKLHCVNR